MSQDHGHFIVPAKFYIATFVALLFLTVITVAVAQLDLGILNTPVALAIAVVKMTLVLLVFMNLYWDKGISTILVIGSFCCIATFFLLTFADVGFRGTITPIDKETFGTKSPVKLIKPGDKHDGKHH